MSLQSNNNKRIAKNTLLLYIRTFLTMAISLYTSRIVLNTLGIEDYGIYNVVGGFVGMFALISATLTASTQRFLTFELGKKTGSHPQEIFSVSLTIHLLIAIVIVLLAEIIGVWFLNTSMSIPEGRIIAANWVFQFSLLTFVLNLISIPYNSAIIAHERMAAFAYISLLETTLKLVIVYILLLFQYDMLILYGVLMFFVALFIRIIYGTYCRKHFEEVKYIWVKDKKYYKRLLSFCSWNIIGSSSAVLTNSGINVLMNIFFGVTANAARGIANQVTNAVNQFVGNFSMAINPQITKSYAAKDYDYMMQLVLRGSRYTFFLMLIMTVPIIAETRYILRLWLGIIPQNTVVFVQLSLIYMLCQSLSNTLYTAMLATGKIKKYQIIVGGLATLAFPASYILFYLGYSPVSSYVATIVISLICLVARLVLLHDMINLPIVIFCKDVIMRVLCVSILSAVVPCLFFRFMEEGLLRFLAGSITTVLTTIFVILFCGISKDERVLIIKKITFFHSKFLL